MKWCETSSIFETDNVKNEAILRDFLQKWQVECRADGIVPTRFAQFFSTFLPFRALWSSFFWLLTLSLLWLFCCCVWHLFILSEIRLLKLPSVAAGAPFSVAFLSYCISWTKTDRSRPMKILGAPGSQNCVRPCTFLQLIKTDRAAAKWIWMGISDE